MTLFVGVGIWAGFYYKGVFAAVKIFSQGLCLCNVQRQKPRDGERDVPCQSQAAWYVYSTCD